jgi:hypothetical protein
MRLSSRTLVRVQLLPIRVATRLKKDDVGATYGVTSPATTGLLEGLSRATPKEKISTGFS